MPLVAPENDRVLNTLLVYGPAGERVARYDKIHLFRFNKGKEDYDESRTIAPGKEVASFKLATEDGVRLRVGLSICYDLRFPELYRAMPRPDLISFLPLLPQRPVERIGKCCCAPARLKTWRTCWRPLKAVDIKTAAPPMATPC